MSEEKKPKVALFVTCLVDLMRPSVAFAALSLLEQAGFGVDVPAAQSCCGQPAYNSGDRKSALKVAVAQLDAFAGYDYVVAPSGSCAAMLRHHYPDLFVGHPREAEAKLLSRRTYELAQFLDLFGAYKGVRLGERIAATYHDACSGLRELGIKDAPRRLLAQVEGLDLKEMKDSEVCCGFGGTFCVKYPDISEAIVSDKVKNIESTGAQLLLAGDLGCLMNMAGRLSRTGVQVEVRHIAEVLAGSLTKPALGAAKDS